MKIYFDVGANDGSSMFQFTNNPHNIVYAFEPTPRMIKILKAKAIERPNYRIIEKAVSDQSGEQEFYIAGQSDWGCSSLNKFNDNLQETWPDRTDFKVTNTIKVDVIRLDEFIEQNNIQRIDYMHCDVQGKDLEVLMSLGQHINKLRAGVLEMPTRHESKLYKNQKYIASDAINYLESHGFKVDKINTNDKYNNECNIYYKKQG